MTITVEVEGIDEPLEFPDGTDPAVIQKTVKRLVADPTIRSATQPFEPAPDTGVGSAVATIASSIPGQIVSGVGGAIDTLVNQESERPARVMQNFQEATTIQPTEAGAQVLGSVGDQINKISKILSLPLDSLDAIATGIQTGDLEQMVRRFDQNRNQPRADRAISEGPLAATAASVGPEAAVEVLGGALGLGGVKALSRTANRFRAVTNEPEITVFDERGRFTDEAIDALERFQTEKVDTTPPADIQDAGVDAAISGLDEPAQVIDEILQEAEEAGAVLTPSQARRLNLFRERGVPALRADITRNTQDSINQQQAIKEGDPDIAPIAAAQDQALIRQAEQGIQKTGGVSTDLDGTNASVASAVEEVALRLDKKVSDAYQAARQVAQGQPVVDLSGFVEVVRLNKGREKITGGVLTSIRQTLKNRGIIGKDGDARVTVEVAEEIRQELNADFPSAKPRGKSLIRELKDAIDVDVEKAAGSDIFGSARAEKIAFQKTLERAKRNKFDKSSGSFLEDVLDNNVPENQIFDRMTRKTFRDDDFIKMKQFLTEDAGDAGKQAWNNIRAQVLRTALDKAISTVQIKEGGQATFNVRLFRNEIKKLKGRKFNELFSPQEKQLIADIEEIGNSRIPIDKTISGEGPSSIAINALRKSFLSRLGPLGEGVQGLVDHVANRGRNKRLMEFTKETEKAIKR